jgi:hypothetical protein
MNSEKYLGLDVRQATISVAVMDSQGATLLPSGEMRGLLLPRSAIVPENLPVGLEPGELALLGGIGADGVSQ